MNAIKTLETNYRPASSPDAWRRFERAIHAPPCISGDSRTRLSLGVMRVLIPILWAAVFLCGCQSPSKLDSGDFDDFLQRAGSSKKQSGDFGAFFVRQVTRYGGQVVNSPSNLEGRWYFESDHDGFAVQLYDTSFLQVRSFLEQVYGPPRDVYTNHYNSWTGLYGVREIGVAIQFFGDTNGVGFICLEMQKQ